MILTNTGVALTFNAQHDCPALLLFCACDIACCRLGCFRSAVTRLHTCTHYSRPVFRHRCWCARIHLVSFRQLQKIYPPEQCENICPPQQCENICPFQRCHADTQSTHITRLVLTISVPPCLLRLHPHVSLLQDTFPSN